MRYVRAIFAEDTGDAVTSIKELRQAFEDTIGRLETTAPDSEDYFDLIRLAAQSGYRYAWNFADDQRYTDAEAVVGKLRKLLEPYDVPSPPPALVWPLAQLHWLESRLYSDVGDTARARQASDRTAALTSNPDIYPGDYVSLARLRFRTLWDKIELAERRKNREQACTLAADIYAVRPNEANATLLVDCDLNRASNAQTEGRLDAAAEAVAAAETRITNFIAESNDTASIGFRLHLVDVELAYKDIASYRSDEAEIARRQLAAAERFVSTLNGRSYFQSSTLQIASLYRAFSGVELFALQEYADRDRRNAAYLDLFRRIATAVERSRATYPNSPSYAIASGESWARVATILLNANDAAGADAASAKGEAAMDQAQLIAQLREVSENAQSECLVRAGRIRVLIALNRPDDAIAAFRRFDRSCGDWTRRYPWEFYARQYVHDVSRRLGTDLRRRGRYAEAVPLLTYASNWGDIDSSFYLADMYRKGQGVETDAKKAKALHELATRQSMKQFAVPTTFGNTKVQVKVYVMQYGALPRCKVQAAPLDPTQTCAGFDGIDDHALWVRELRGGEMAKDVVESFQKLDRIAQKTNVSFPELALNTLGEKRQAAKDTPRPPSANKPTSDATPEPLTAALPNVLRTKLFAVDVRGAVRRKVETRVIPFLPKGGCFAWEIKVTPENRKVEVRQVVDFPRAPAHLPVSATASIENNGRRSVIRTVKSLANGEISNGNCQEAGDPTGVHRLEVYVGQKSLFSVDFELVPDDGLFEWEALKTPAAKNGKSATGGSRETTSPTSTRRDSDTPPLR